MDNWFDTLCLRLAGKQHVPPVTWIPVPGNASGRRSFLKTALSGTALGFFNGDVPAAGQGPAKPTVPLQKNAVNLSNIAPQLPPDQCQRVWNGSNLTQSVKVTQGNVSLQYALSYDATAKALSNSITIAQSSAAIFTSTLTGTPGGLTTVHLSYGAAISGVKTATFSSKDGQTVQGTIDGRAVTIQQTNATKQTEFLDHRPPPTITIAPALHDAIITLAKQLDSRLRSCYSSSAGTTASRGVLRDLSLKPGGNGANDPGDGWYLSGGTYDSPGCDSCLDGCGHPSTDVQSIIDDIENIFEALVDAASLAEALLTYFVNYTKCIAGCYLPYGGCCPVPCGGAFTCCGRNDQ